MGLKYLNLFMNKSIYQISFIIFTILSAQSSFSAEFNVGPKQTLSSLEQVPWLKLKAGDIVNIFYRAEPYRTKIGLQGRGTKDAPIIIRGIKGPNNELPTISGENARTPASLKSFFNERWDESLGVILIKRERSTPGVKRDKPAPKFITIENLKIVGANKNNTYINSKGAIKAYNRAAASIFAILVENLTVRGCEISANGNGFFVLSKGDADSRGRAVSKNILFEHNRVYGNGVVGSDRQHNIYTQAAGITFQYNELGKLRKGAHGSQLKDRSSGTIIRYNRIEAGARALDLVDPEDAYGYITVQHDFKDTYVYGNLFINNKKDKEHISAGNLIQYGGDSGETNNYRNGTLHFYNNTVVIISDKTDSWRVNIFDLSLAQSIVELKNNILYRQGDSKFNLMRYTGVANIKGVNWISKGWQKGRPGSYGFKGIVNISKDSVIESSIPCFVDVIAHNYSLKENSVCVDRGVNLLPSVDGISLDKEYKSKASFENRTVRGKGPDLGAFEFSIYSPVEDPESSFDPKAPKEPTPDEPSPINPTPEEPFPIDADIPIDQGTPIGSGRLIFGIEYHVGPNQEFTSLNQVPWLELQAGDIVNIHYRIEPYRAKIGLRGRGTEQAPIIIRGVKGPNGKLPIISGENASTPESLDGFFDVKQDEDLAVILIKRGSDDEYDHKPAHITIENLEIVGGFNDYFFKDSLGNPRRYNKSAAAIRGVSVEDLIVRGCEINNNGNGIVVSSGNNEDYISRNILIEKNHIYGNGIQGGYHQHNINTQASGITFQYNDLGQLRKGANGSTLTDRSAGTIIRYNKIESGVRALDLVDPGKGYDVLTNETDFYDTFVYGNLILNNKKDKFHPSAGRLIHYGGDSGEVNLYRKGVLHFYNNTVVINSDRTDSWRVVVFDLSTNEETVELKNNIFYRQGDSLLLLMSTRGIANIEGVNWINEEWIEGREDYFSGTVNLSSNGFIDGYEHCFVDVESQNYQLDSNSLCVDAGVDLLIDGIALDKMYKESATFENRHESFDLGAFEVEDN